MMDTQTFLKIAGFAVALAACAPGMDEGRSTYAPAPREEQSSVSVRNDFFGEVDVYVVTGAIRARIGSVRAAQSANFRIPSTFMVRPEIQFQVDPIGPEPPFNYRPIALTPGNHVELAVAPALQMSSYAIVVSR